MVVSFVSWRDREEVLRHAANKLRGTNVYITEDMSKKMREHRHELQKYARQESATDIFINQGDLLRGLYRDEINSLYVVG